MSNLPGNHYMQQLVECTMPKTPESLATLALAYEQRTANLLKVLELQGRMHDAQQAFNLSAFDVAERLGMRAEK